LFAGVVAALSAAFAWTATNANRLWAQLAVVPKATFHEGVDPGGYAGVPWAVQATMVALVYPIVVSFITLMLQRRAHSTVALRVYVLDSAIVPAGACSIGLLLAMGVQFFALPFASTDYLNGRLAALLVFNGTWLFLNVLLTGFFLARTVNFVQDEESRHAFTRLAVDVVLRSELTAAVKQHLLVNASEEEWGYGPADDFDGSDRPNVILFGWAKGTTQVEVDVRGKQVLHDVHLHLLRAVAWSWCRRTGALQRKEQKRPTISFPPKVGAVATGKIRLCAVQNGPALNWFERLLVRTAYVYRPANLGSLALTTKAMLTEVAGEVESLAEQNRYGAARDCLRRLLELHKTLLKACATDQQDMVLNAATINSTPYSLTESSFGRSWLEPYREISRIAVGLLDKDSRLFQSVGHVHGGLASGLLARPERLIIDGLDVGTNLAYDLGAWWMRQAQASLAPGTTTFGGVLPPPMSQVYERTVTVFIGAWGYLSVQIPERSVSKDEDVWLALAARARIYAAHIDSSVMLFVDAVSRGDEIAATWLYESFLKWWGNHSHELRDARFAEWRFRRSTLSLADKTWSEAQGVLWDGSAPISIELAEEALNLAIRRYWESMRLYLVMLLVHNAGDTPGTDSREIRFAAGLLQHRAYKGGSRVEAMPLDTVDAVSTGILEARFGDEVVRARMDSIADKLTRNSRQLQVPLWIYTWSGGDLEVDSMTAAQAKLLVAVAERRGSKLRSNKKLVESWWRDVDKLASVARFLRELKAQVGSREFRTSLPAVNAIRQALGRAAPNCPGRIAAFRMLRALGRVSVHERIVTLRSLSVSQEVVRRTVASISSHAFQLMGDESSPVVNVTLVPGLGAPIDTWDSIEEKQAFVAGLREPEEGFIQTSGQIVRENAIAVAFSRYLARMMLIPVNTTALRSITDEPTVGDLQAFVSEVAAQCARLRASGERPAVLIGGTSSEYLRAHRWGDGDWQAPLPADVVVRSQDSERGETASSYLNDSPVYEFDTPDDHCYVVPLRHVQTLRVAGASASSALSASWTNVNDEKIRLSISWCAEMGP
jgi:hypothetical protein